MRTPTTDDFKRAAQALRNAFETVQDLFHLAEITLGPSSRPAGTPPTETMPKQIWQFFDERNLLLAYEDLEEWLEADHDPAARAKIEALQQYLGTAASEVEVKCIKFALAACRDDEDRLRAIAQFLKASPETRAALARQMVTRNWGMAFLNSVAFEPRRRWNETRCALPEPDALRLYDGLDQRFNTAERWAFQHAIGKIADPTARLAVIKSITNNPDGSERSADQWRRIAIARGYLNQGLASRVNNGLTAAATRLAALPWGATAAQLNARASTLAARLETHNNELRARRNERLGIWRGVLWALTGIRTNTNTGRRP